MVYASDVDTEFSMLSNISPCDSTSTDRSTNSCDEKKPATARTGCAQSPVLLQLAAHATVDIVLLVIIVAGIPGASTLASLGKMLTAGYDSDGGQVLASCA